jgi:MFS family permease
MAQPVPHRVGFWIVAGAFAALQAFGTVPTPLWPLYAVRDHLSSTEITLMFAALVVGAAFSLYYLGHLSDRFGRRRIIVPALLAGIAAGLIEAFFPTLPGLVAGRVLNGIAIGLMASTATTYLTDLYRAAHPDRPGSRAPATVATVANLGGLSLGPLVSGALARWVGHPLVTPYAIFIALMAVAVISVLATPETVDRKLPVTGVSRFAVQDGRRGAYTGAVAVAFCAFAIFGLFSSIGSLIVRGELHIASPFVWGVAGFVVLGVSAVAQTVFAKLPLPRMLAYGLATTPVGMAVVVYAVYNPSLALYLIGSAIAGAGAGLLFKAALSGAIATAVPGSAAGVLAMLFVVAYVGMGIPPVLLAVATTMVSSNVALIGFSVVIAAVSLVAGRMQAMALRAPAPRPARIAEHV